MIKIFGALSTLSLAIALLFVQAKPASADVVVNNVLSPFSVTVVGPGHRVYGGRPPWRPYAANEYGRCHTYWDQYVGEWRQHCHRRFYGPEYYRDDHRRSDYYRDDYRGGYYRSGYRGGYNPY